MVGDKLKNYILLFLLFSNLIFSMTLSDVKGAENLKNYDLIKNIRIERIAEAEYYGSNSQIKRRGGIAYFKGETKPYKGVLISKDNGKILAIYFYENVSNIKNSLLPFAPFIGESSTPISSYPHSFEKEIIFFMASS